jgi:hypothetical protein
MKNARITKEAIDKELKRIKPYNTISGPKRKSPAPWRDFFCM